jgi:hypothetical protein
MSFLLRIMQCVGVCVLLPNWVSAAATPLSNNRNMSEGWRITQDVRDLGETVGWYKPGFAADWQAIDRLAHLQLLLAKQPYFGRELRYFNEHAWWYRLEFPISEFVGGATLRFGGVDYFSKVWLNGTLLGEHEGYADPFEFEVGPLLVVGKPNVLVVEVSSPWDHQYRDPTQPFWSVERNLQKGSYEHATAFVQRDVNPIGIWRPVSLIFHENLHESAEPRISTVLSSNQRKANLNIVWPVVNDGAAGNMSVVVHIRAKDTEREVATSTHSVKVEHGPNELRANAIIALPRLWTTWDRGAQPLYEVRTELIASRTVQLTSSATIGVRSVELRRSDKETRFYVNGRPLYLRGTTYWPDVYLSNMNRARYERDIRAAIRAGFNSFRVHVHTENPEFYEICDRLGMVVFQDNDLNWVFPSDPAFSARAVAHFGTLIRLLQNHPSVVSWISMNEVGFDLRGQRGYRSSGEELLGSQLVAAAHRLDPTRPVVENSMDAEDPESGDSHDYRGSITGGDATYFDIAGSQDKFVTEFGVEAPPAYASLRAVPEAVERLRDVLPRVGELHDYQYHLLKYYIEHYRIQKYSPNAGYFQFMWIDFSPQSFYGVYDYWGGPKAEGIGGGLLALQESNQPIGIFLEHGTKPLALYVVNDTSVDLGHCVARWRVTDSTGSIEEGKQSLALGPDSHKKIRDFGFPAKEGVTYNVVLDLMSADGKTLAHNSYRDPFAPQPRPEGYPDRFDEELGMQLWWAK